MIGVLWKSTKSDSPTRVPIKYSYHLNEDQKKAFIAKHSSEDFIPSEENLSCQPEDPLEYQIVAESENGVWDDELIRKLNKLKKL